MTICSVANFGNQSLPTEMLVAIMNRKLARLQKKQRKSVQIRQTIKSFTAIIWATRFKLISTICVRNINYSLTVQSTPFLPQFNT